MLIFRVLVSRAELKIRTKHPIAFMLFLWSLLAVFLILTPILEIDPPNRDALQA